MPPKVSIVLPYIRPDGAAQVSELCEQNAGLEPGEFEIIAEEDFDLIGCPKMVARLVDRASGDYICFVGDDTRPQPGFLKNALDEMAKLPDGWGLVGFSDGTGRDLPCHWIAHRNLQQYLEDGEFFFTGYGHCFCDRELRDIAKEQGRFTMAWDAVVDHDHPIVNHTEITGEYAKTYEINRFMADKALYEERREERRKPKRERKIKLGIGLPLCDSFLPKGFFLSYITMQKPDYSLLLPTYTTQDLGAVRNSLVRQALAEKCTHLIMMDTDQVYPPDTIEKLLSHRRDAVGALVHKRWPPYNAVFYKGSPGQYVQQPDDVVYSGDLVEVDATGTGCICFDMDVFKDIPEPWFKLEINPDGTPIGEDIYFCNKMRAYDYKIFIDTTVEVGHIAELVIDKDFYKRFRLANPYEWTHRSKDKKAAA